MRTRIIITLGSILMLLLLVHFSISGTVTLSESDSTQRGDINEDGKVDIFDLLELLKTLANMGEKTERTLQIADVNDSGAVDIFDLLGLLKVLSGSEQPEVIYWQGAPPGDSTVVQGITFVYIPGGTFQMGQAGVAEPVHQVTISSFFMGRYEITQAQYQAVIGSNPSYFTGDTRRPVEQVWLNEVATFCNKLSEAEGLQPCYTLGSLRCDFTKNGYRLPTEAEWEYACRAGTTTNYYTGDSEADLAKAGWYGNNSRGTTHAVGKKLVNAFGLFDMHGNVMELCNDWYGDYSIENAYDPQGPSSGSNFIQRGGSWNLSAGECRSAWRASNPGLYLFNCGFRVMRSDSITILQGSIFESGRGLSGVSVHCTGNGVDSTVNTGTYGRYSFTGLANGTYTITPKKSGYIFNPACQEVTVGGGNSTASNIIATSPKIDTTVVQGITLVSIPGGTFQMGPPGHEHSVTLDAFQIGRYEITQAQYQTVVGSNPSAKTGDTRRPVERVNWKDAVQFCNKLSKLAGLDSCYNLTTWACDFTKKGFRLPTEAEWEYACRAGTTTRYYTGETYCAEELAAWYYGNNPGAGETHAVGRKQPNAFTLFDMLGNVAEWCNDWWSDYYTTDSENNPHGPSSGEKHVAKGGSCSHGDCDATERSYNANPDPEGRDYPFGFRVVRR